MRFALLWILRTCCLFTMTVKGKWTDVPARSHFLIITFLERVYIYPHLWYDNARNLGFREVTSCPNTSLQSTSLLCRTPSNSKAAVNVRLPASPLAKQAAPLATCSAQNRKKQKQREHKLMHGQAPGLETGGFSCERMDEGGRKTASEFSALPDRLRRTIPLKP